MACICRYDMSERPEDTSVPDYLSSGTTEFSAWYSLLPEAEMDELKELLSGISSENAELVQSLPQES